MKSIYSTGDVEKVIKEVGEALKDCTFIVYCSDYNRFDDISKQLRKALPKANAIGTTGYMFNEKGSFEAGVSATGFTDDEVEVYVGTLRRVDSCPIKYLPGLIWTVDEINKRYKDNLCIEFSTGHEERVVSTMKVSLEMVGMRLLGGTAGNVPEGQPKKVAMNGKVLTDCAVYAVIGSKMGRIDIYKENLFHPRKKTHIVTRVSDDCRTIYEIDGRKAMDVYEEELGYTSATVSEGVYENPLTRIVGTDNYITAIYSFNDDRSISTYKNIQRNDMISFTDIDVDYKGYINSNMNQAISGKNVAGILSVNCILRYLYFENNQYTADYAKLMNRAANGNHFGIVGDGEQYVEQHVNQSMVCAVFTREK